MYLCKRELLTRQCFPKNKMKQYTYDINHILNILVIIYKTPPTS